MREIWRPALGFTLGITLCILAVAEAAGVGTAPTWFLSVSIPIIVGLAGEGAYRKNKEK